MVFTLLLWVSRSFHILVSSARSRTSIALDSIEMHIKRNICIVYQHHVSVLPYSENKIVRYRRRRRLIAGI